MCVIARRRDRLWEIRVLIPGGHADVPDLPAVSDYPHQVRLAQRLAAHLGGAASDPDLGSPAVVADVIDTCRRLGADPGRCVVAVVDAREPWAAAYALAAVRA